MTAVIGLHQYPFTMNRSFTFLSVLCFSVFFFSCSQDCDYRDWQGQYIGTVYCDDSTTDGVIVDVFLDTDGATTVIIGDYWSTYFFEDGCDVEFLQRSSVGRDDFEEEYKLELKGNELSWEYELNDNGFERYCEGEFVRF